MEISSLSSTAIQGLQNSQNQLTRSAINIAGKEAQEGKTEVTQDLVEMKDASHSFNASAKMVKAGADVMGTLLDIKA